MSLLIPKGLQIFTGNETFVSNFFHFHQNTVLSIPQFLVCPWMDYSHCARICHLSLLHFILTMVMRDNILGFSVRNQHF